MVQWHCTETEEGMEEALQRDGRRDGRGIATKRKKARKKLS